MLPGGLLASELIARLTEDLHLLNLVSDHISHGCQDGVLAKAGGGAYEVAVIQDRSTFCRMAARGASNLAGLS